MSFCVSHPSAPRRASRATLVAFALFVLTSLLVACEAPTERDSVAAEASHPEGTAPGAATGLPAPRRALWVLAQGHVRVLDDPTRVPTLIDHATALGATDLYVQVYRGGRAWYDASLADASPHRRVMKVTGQDSLALLLEQATAAGLRIHAWVNVLSLSQNPEAPILEVLGRQIVHVDRQGRSLLDYPEFEVPEPDRRNLRMGTPGIYLDPGAPGLADYLARVFEELLVRYPALAGLHLDYIRYPDVLPFSPGSSFGVGLDFGYGEATRARFRTETGLEAPFGDRTTHARRWDDWRRDRVREVVAGIATRARAARPGVELSAAVWTWANRAYLSMGQDWRGWLEDELIDVAVPMAYTRDHRLLRYQVEHFAGLPDRARIIPGLGTWLFARDPDGARHQIEIAREAGLRDVALFSYDSIVAAPDLHAALAQAFAR